VHCELKQLGFSEDLVWVVIGVYRVDHGCSSYQPLRSPRGSDRFTEVTAPTPLGHTGATPAVSQSAAMSSQVLNNDATWLGVGLRPVCAGASPLTLRLECMRF
jgi:hypothetical protein